MGRGNQVPLAIGMPGAHETAKQTAQEWAVGGASGARERLCWGGLGSSALP